MKNVKVLFESIQNEKLITSKRGASPTIKSTQRNKIKKQVENAFLEDLRDLIGHLTVIEKTDKGIIIGLEHEDLFRVADASGEISFEMNIKVKNLDYDIMNESVEYQKDLELKAQRIQERKENKERKIKRDNYYREQKKELEKNRAKK